MALNRIDETELLPPLHEGMHEEPRWTTFLNRLRRSTRADYAGLIFRQGDAPIHEATELFSGRNVRAAGRQLQSGDLYALDPIRYNELRPGRVYSAEEMIDPDDRRHERFRRDYLDRIGVRYGRFMRVVEPGGVSAWVTLSKEADDFSASDSALVSALAPHLAIALRNFAVLEQARFRAAAAEAALQRAGIGWAAMDRDGRVIDVSETYGRQLEDSAGRRAALGSRLVTGAADTDRVLLEAARAFAADDQAPAQIVRIMGEPDLEMLVAPAREQPLTAPLMPALLAFTRVPSRTHPHRARVLAQQFGLSPKEAELALALSEGRSIEEAARALGLTVETGRHYSKRLFAKTGTRGQADLVRLVLSTVGSLA